MRVLVAPDSFKDALSAKEAAIAIAQGLTEASDTLQCTLLPMADGGEGTGAILCEALGGEWINTACYDALQRKITGSYAWIAREQLAVIELAEAAGLQQLSFAERNPLHTSTFGLGLLMRDALQRGARKIILTLGGSATHDCGTGMLAALGWQFFEGSNPIDRPTGADLSRITAVVAPPSAPQFRCTILCDVANPLLGPRGAAHTFASQKGATYNDIDVLESGTARFAAIGDAYAQKRLNVFPGAGSAGGTSYGALVFLNAELQSGAEEILRIAQFDLHLAEADLVITGEGCFDGQTAQGKLISAIAAKCKAASIPLFVFCGKHVATTSQQEDMGVTGIFPLANGASSIEECLATTNADLKRVAFQLGRTLVSMPFNDRRC